MKAELEEIRKRQEQEYQLAELKRRINIAQHELQLTKSTE